MWQLKSTHKAKLLNIKLFIYIFSTFLVALSLQQNLIHAAVKEILPRPKTLILRNNCFHPSIIKQTVLDSQIIFIGKILNLVESTPTRSSNISPDEPPTSMFSETLTNPNNKSEQFSYYHYNHIGPPSKKRRASYRQQHSHHHHHYNHNNRQFLSQFQHHHEQDSSNENDKYLTNSFTATVHVKTVFKGQKKYSNAQSQSKDLHEGFEGRIIAVKIKLYNANILNKNKINVKAANNNNNFSSSSSCFRRLRILDTRIFFYKSHNRSLKNGSSSKIVTNTTSSNDDDDSYFQNANDYYESSTPQEHESEREGERTIDLIQTLMPLPPTLGILKTVRQAVKGLLEELFSVHEQLNINYRCDLIDGYATGLKLNVGRVSPIPKLLHRHKY